MNNIDAMYITNIDAFYDTRELSKTKYKLATDRMLRSVHVYSDADDIIKDYAVSKNIKMKVSFVNGGTASTAYDLKRGKNRVAMLNFADAKKPGGWVELGAPTQEENLCRCTNLYEALLLQKCHDNYYVRNNKYNTDAHLDEAYTDALIYVENATIFKDDKTYKEINPRQVDVITSPAPCGDVSYAERVMIHRIKGIVKSAYLHGVTHIVLGAWGCGAFAQDPVVVGRCFAVVLSELPVFDEVVFAIRSTEGFKSDTTFDKFSKSFWANYEV